MSRKKREKKVFGQTFPFLEPQRLAVKKFLWKPTKLYHGFWHSLVWISSLMNLMFFLVWTQFIWIKFEIDYIFRVSIKLKKYFKLENVKNQGQIPFARHYNPRFLYFLPLKSSSKVIKWPLFLFKMMKFSLKQLHSSLNSHF